MSVAAPPRPPTRTRGARQRLSAREDGVTLVLSLWLIIGLFVDGWAHNNLTELETFFTPWHALFYSGFTACAAWFAWLVIRGQDRGLRGLAGVPAGYGLGLAGLAVFAIGGAGDFTWHAVFGIEQDLDALFSPTHLVLMVGMALIVTSPLRAAWHAGDDRDASRLARFLPALLSLTLLVSLIAFFFMYLSAFTDLSPTHSPQDRANQELDPYWLQLSGITSALVTNLVLVVPVLHLLRRWHPPVGSVTILFTTVAVLVNGIAGFATVLTVVPAVVAGVAGDVLVARLRPSPARPAAYRAFGAVLPLIFWIGYYATLGVAHGLTWSLEMWTGMIVYNTLAGLLVAQLFLPLPAVDRSATAPVP
jgi:hypothetical protein